MNNVLKKSELTSEQLSIVQSELEKKKKSNVIMYVLWWCTGVVGGHRFYLGDTGYALGMLFTLGGFGVWAIIDVFLIGKRLELKTNQLESDIINDVLVSSKKPEVESEAAASN